jgi:hypothetical protein
VSCMAGRGFAFRSPAAVGVALTASALAFVLGGCASNRAEPAPSPSAPFSIADAKLQAQTMEDRLAAEVPSANVASTDQQAEGVLLSCANGQHQWTGRTTVTVQGETDFTAILDATFEKWHAKHGFEAERSRAGDGAPEVQIFANDGQVYLVGPTVAGDRYLIASASACFTLPKGTYPGGLW